MARKMDNSITFSRMAILAIQRILASSVPAGVGPAAALAARLVFIIADTIGAAGAVVGRARQRDTADVT